MCVLEHKEEVRHVLKECLSNESVKFFAHGMFNNTVQIILTYPGLCLFHYCLSLIEVCR